MALNFVRQNSLLMIYSIFSLFALVCFSNASKPRNNNNGGRLKGMFIFGTSVVDNGNNNNIIGSLAKANYPPYGIDFANGTATGRFSNGNNVADFISGYLKLPLIPAFADPKTKGNKILNGVNFGSGGSGILDETGMVAGKVISLNEQIRNFETETLPELEKQLRCQRRKLLNDYLFLVAAGNNDYLLNYFLFGQNFTTPQAFAAKLISAYSDQLKRLYNLGARKFVLLSVYPLGCSPVISKGKGCIPGPNAVVAMFYDQLILMVNQTKPQMPGVQFVVVNPAKIIIEVLNNPGSTGIINGREPCCELSANGVSCKANGSICDDRNSYAYFDGQHNTESLSAILATKAFASRDPSEVYPFNLQNLIKLNSKF